MFKSKFFKNISIFTIICLILSMFPMGVTVNAVTQAVYYVSPIGSDLNPGTETLPFKTITKARDAVRLINGNMTGDIYVYLRGGTYTISSTISLNQTDSGTNGYNVIYKAYQGETPVISGGNNVTGWSQVSGSSIWQASCSVDNFRQLYVNGFRAKRARSSGSYTGTGWYNNTSDATSVKDGIYVNDSVIGYYNNASDIELSWVIAWRSLYEKVGSITTGGSGQKIINMQQPYFSYGTNFSWFGSNYAEPFYIENALELLDTPGEWYLNRNTDTLYYWPKQGENMSTSEVIAPVLEKMLEIKGSSLTSKAHNIQFYGITFMHSTWLKPSQIGFHTYQGAIYNEGYDPSDDIRSLVAAAIQIDRASNIRFERNTLENLGAVGIGLLNGVNSGTIIGNTFKNLANAAITVGLDSHDYISAGEEVCKDNTISNNYIYKIGQDYPSAQAIAAIYVENLDINHNTIENIPYTGISVGWGWDSRLDSTTCKDNKIRYNMVDTYMKTAIDGGGIYTLGQQPNTIITGNYLKNMTHAFGAIYHDQGSRYYTTTNNVIDTAPYWLMLSNFVNLPVSDMTIQNNYSTTSSWYGVAPVNSTYELAQVYSSSAWPQVAQDIINAAGVETPYKDIIPGLSLTPVLPAPAGTENVVIDATADITIKQDQPTSNFNGINEIDVKYDAAAARQGLIRFSVTGITGKTLNSVKLRLTESKSSSAGDTSFEVRKTTSSWTETGVTWNTKPTTGTTVYGSYTSGQLKESQTIDIPLDNSFLSGDGTYELALIPTSGINDIGFASKEVLNGSRLLINVNNNTTMATFNSIADSTVKQSQPTTNFNFLNEADVQYSTTGARQSFLRFSVTGLTGKTINSIKLRLTECTTGSAGNTNFEVRKTTSAWTETGVTWNTKPTTGTTIYGNYTGGQLSENQVIDIILDNSFLSGDGTYEIAMIPTGGTLDEGFATREVANGPQLVVNYSNSDSSNITFNSIADSTVKQSWPTTNFNFLNEADVQYSTTGARQSFLRFSVTGLTGKTINSIKLRLTECTTGSAGNTNFEVRKTTSAWTETGVTWNTKPTTGTTIYGSYTGGQLSENQVIEIILDNSFLSGDGTYEIAMIPTSGTLDEGFATREVANGPQLIVNYQ